MTHVAVPLTHVAVPVTHVAVPVTHVAVPVTHVDCRCTCDSCSSSLVRRESVDRSIRPVVFTSSVLNKMYIYNNERFL